MRHIGHCENCAAQNRTSLVVKLAVSSHLGLCNVIDSVTAGLATHWVLTKRCIIRAVFQVCAIHALAFEALSSLPVSSWGTAARRMSFLRLYLLSRKIEQHTHMLHRTYPEKSPSKNSSWGLFCHFKLIGERASRHEAQPI